MQRWIGLNLLTAIMSNTCWALEHTINNSSNTTLGLEWHCAWIRYIGKGNGTSGGHVEYQAWPDALYLLGTEHTRMRWTRTTGQTAMLHSTHLRTSNPYIVYTSYPTNMYWALYSSICKTRPWR
jgi:hypothetical protein